MPQTVEHLNIVKSLNIKEGFVVLTKCDVVDRETIQLAKEEISLLVKSTPFERNPIIEFSAKENYGKDEVLETLKEIARKIKFERQGSLTRYFVDRCFVLKGGGKVVTGLLTSGEINIQDRLQVYPTEDLAVVRKIQRHYKEVNMVHGGQRAGLNLSFKGEIERGMILGRPGELKPTHIINVFLTVFESASRPLKHQEKVFVYHLSTEVQGKVVFYNRDYLNPGESDLVQIRLEKPIFPFFDDPLIVRFLDPNEASAGGTVVDTNPPKLRRGTYCYFEELKNLKTREEMALLSPLMRSVLKNPDELSKESGLEQGEIQRLLEHFLKTGKVTKLKNGSYALTSKFEEYKRKIMNLFNSNKNGASAQSCMTREEIYSKIKPPFSADTLNLIITELKEEGRLFESGTGLYPAKINLNPKEKALMDQILEKLKGSPPLREIEIFSIDGCQPEDIRSVLSFLIKTGSVIRFKTGAYMKKEEFEEARQAIINYLIEKTEITVIEARDFLKWGRRATITFLEHLDKEGITVRFDNTRKLSKSYVERHLINRC
jgi:selenocysteine-specific elongation factor